MSAAPELLVKAVTYNSIELSWDENNNVQEGGSRKLYHVKLDRARGRSPCPGGPNLDPLMNYQGYAQKNVFNGLDPTTQYLARIKVLEDGKGEEGFWSEAIAICTEKEPPSGAELHRAVARENIEEVRKILEENSAVVEVMDKLGYTPLMVAAQKGFIIFCIVPYRAQFLDMQTQNVCVVKCIQNASSFSRSCRVFHRVLELGCLSFRPERHVFGLAGLKSCFALLDNGQRKQAQRLNRNPGFRVSKQ